MKLVKGVKYKGEIIPLDQIGAGFEDERNETLPYILSYIELEKMILTTDELSENVFKFPKPEYLDKVFPFYSKLTKEETLEEIFYSYGIEDEEVVKIEIFENCYYKK